MFFGEIELKKILSLGRLEPYSLSLCFFSKEKKHPKGVYGTASLKNYETTLEIFWHSQSVRIDKRFVDLFKTM